MLGGPPVNPAGAAIHITVTNVGVQPIVRLGATLYLGWPYNLSFLNVSTSSPIHAGEMLTLVSVIVGPDPATCGENFPIEFLGAYASGTTFDQRVPTTMTCAP